MEIRIIKILQKCTYNSKGKKMKKKEKRRKLFMNISLSQKLMHLVSVQYTTTRLQGHHVI